MPSLDVTGEDGSDGGHRFAAAMQSALSVAEVEQAYLANARSILRAGAYGFYQLDPESGSMLAVAASACPILLENYESYGRCDDPVLDFVVEHHRPIDSSRAIRPAGWSKSGARAALGASGLAHSLEAPVLVSGVLYGTVNFARTRDQGAFTRADLMSARRAAEQLQLAVERGMRFEATGRRTSMLENALDQIPQQVVVTDLEARVLFRNRAAERAEVGGPSPSHVDHCIAEAMTEFRRDGKRVSTRSYRDDTRHVVIKSYRLPEQDEAAVSLVYDCQDQAAPKMPVWGVLTPREQEIAQLVSEGLTTKQIAARAFVSENTVKQHLKRVFAKTDVRTRAELMQRIWSSGSMPGRS